MYVQSFWVAPSLLPFPRKMTIYVFNNVSRRGVASRAQSTSGQELSFRPWDMQSNPKKVLGDDNYGLEMSSLGF